MSCPLWPLSQSTTALPLPDSSILPSAMATENEPWRSPLRLSRNCCLRVLVFSGSPARGLSPSPPGLPCVLSCPQAQPQEAGGRPCLLLLSFSGPQPFLSWMLPLVPSWLLLLVPLSQWLQQTCGTPLQRHRPGPLHLGPPLSLSAIDFAGTFPDWPSPDQLCLQPPPALAATPTSSGRNPPQLWPRPPLQLACFFNSAYWGLLGTSRPSAASSTPINSLFSSLVS